MNKYTEAIQGDNVVILCDGIPMGVSEILDALNEATPPADAALGDAVAPGVMRCAKCKFGLQRVILSVRSGTASAGNSKTEPCPNGCGPLWPVTWKELAKEHLEVAERFFDESAVLRKDNETLRAELTALRAAQKPAVEPLGFFTGEPIFTGEHIEQRVILNFNPCPEGTPCYEAPPSPEPAKVADVDWLANVIRTVDGNNSLGAGALAEAIVAAMLAASGEGKP
jgi:hypothetical protein